MEIFSPPSANAVPDEGGEDAQERKAGGQLPWWPFSLKTLFLKIIKIQIKNYNTKNKNEPPT